MTRKSGLVSSVVLAAALLFAAGPVTAQRPAPAPAFSYDVAWMKLPAQWTIGDISAVAVDRADNVWVLHRPRTIPQDRRDRAAPPVLQFDSTGRFIKAWGGEGEGYEWPGNEHSLTIDDKDRVWISGSLRTAAISDDMILAFDKDGKFIRQIGRRGAGKGDQDTENLKAPADLFVDTRRNELYAADGYGDRRVIVFDTETGKFKRMWGAFGRPPPTTPPPPAGPAMAPDGAVLNETGDGSPEFNAVHGVELSRDGRVYVADRNNRRIQVFDRMGAYKTQVFVSRNRPPRQTVGGMALSPDRAQRYLYAADFGNSEIAVFDRRTLALITALGPKGTGPGQFTGPHLIASDSKGALYVAEVQGGRVQKLSPAR